MSSTDRPLTRRERQAQDTRREILDAARRLFADRGYGAVPVSEIAAEAGVAVQTIYASWGSKRALLWGLLDVVDEQADVGDIAAALFATDDPVEAVRLSVRLNRRVNERAGDIVWALFTGALTDPDAAAALDDGVGRHREGFAQLARKLKRAGALREGLTAPRASAVMGTATSHEVWRKLTSEYGWSYDEAERFIADSLIALVLRGDPAAP
jgi:AcrR family transcriptional regulator